MRDHPELLSPGAPAPAFSLPLTTYESVTLSDLYGALGVLAFYPGDWEPISSEQLALYQRHLSDFQDLGATLLGISVDSVWSHAALRRTLNLTYPLLSDFHPKGMVCRAYRVYATDDGCSRRAVVIVDEDGLVRWARAYPINLNPGIDPILSVLEELRAGTGL